MKGLVRSCRLLSFLTVLAVSAVASADEQRSPESIQMWTEGNITFNASNNFTIAREVLRMESADGHHYPVEQVTATSPWGESMRLFARVHDGRSMSVLLGDLQIEITMDDKGSLASFVVDNGVERAEDVRFPGSKDLGAINRRPYELVSAELEAKHSPEFIESMKALALNREGVNAPAAFFGDCTSEATQCALGIVGYVGSIWTLMACSPGPQVVACLWAIFLHDAAAAAAVISCAEWIWCLEENCS